jgi:uncharacterized membrane protein (UPF0127 family)
MEGFETTDVRVDDESLVVAVAETSAQRRQGLQGVSELPVGVDGMLFVFDVAREASFHMRTVGLDLDIWWFDANGSLLGSTLMVTCPDGRCVSYPSPGAIMWALETPSGAYGFSAGAKLETS